MVFATFLCGCESKARREARPGTCEAAGERYIELYVKEARAAGMEERTQDTARLDRKKKSFIEDCNTKVTAGKLQAEQLGCAVQAESLEAGNRCLGGN
jgi:hypothetical protein